MRRGTRASVCLIGGLLTTAWAQPASAGDPSRPSVQRPSIHVATPEPATQAEPPATLVPAPRAALPSYQTPVASDDLDAPIAREVPRDGRGMLAIGSFAVVGGATLCAGTTVLAVEDLDFGLQTPMLLLGGAVTLTGSLLLWGGRRRQLGYRKWAAAQPDVAPRQGTGLIGSGSALLVGGATVGISGTAGLAASMIGDDPEGGPVLVGSIVLLGLGVGSLAAGAALMNLGMSRHRRFQAWRTSDVQLVPNAAPLTGGARIGVSGRF